MKKICAKKQKCDLINRKCEIMFFLCKSVCERSILCAAQCVFFWGGKSTGITNILGYLVGLYGLVSYLTVEPPGYTSKL